MWNKQRKANLVYTERKVNLLSKIKRYLQRERTKIKDNGIWGGPWFRRSSPGHERDFEGQSVSK